MPGFDAIYKQTVTLFNRVKDDNDEEFFIPTVLPAVHLVIDHSAVWNTYGGQQSDNVRLHVRYLQSEKGPTIGDKRYVEPKDWKRLKSFDESITFRYGNDNDFDFFVKDSFEVDSEKTVGSITANGETVTLSNGFISDMAYDEYRGFYNYLNKMYDHVFAVTAVSQYNLIPHFEIMAR